jgi:MoaA/NifB/PqqE/SkfB family radical SAM enzyme
MNLTDDILSEFKNNTHNNISIDDFVVGANELHQKFKNHFPTINDVKKRFNNKEIVSMIIDSINNKNKIKNFKFNNSKNCCLAPYSTLNFDTMGYIRVCCYNNYFILGKYPNTSLVDAWNNPEKENFINKIKSLNFPGGCEQCNLQIIENNVSNSLFASFDDYDKMLIDDAPIALNFDFGSICNYECIMCGGKWSSSIRKNREKLPSLKGPYDDNFIEQLKPFISKAKVVNFLGGEPFLNPIYYKIWNYMLIRNPNLNIHITTNGSIFNSKIKNYLINFPNLKLNISLDSLKKETYEFIRKNGNFENVMNNIQEFKKMGKIGGIAFCPMIQNVYELPDIFNYCIKNKFSLYLNHVTSHLGGKIKGIHEGELQNTKVWTGSNDYFDEINVNNSELIPEVSLHTLPKDKLKEIIKYLNSFSEYQNNQKYKDFINSLSFYCNDKYIKDHV